jgi:hypothetical protein
MTQYWEYQLMLGLKRVPWFSLALVLLSYSNLGWVISEIEASWLLWLVLGLAILLLLVCLTTPWSRITDYRIFFKSNTRTFGLAVLAAFLLFVIIAWFHVFLDTLLITSATILVKMDFQTQGLKKSLFFGFASLFSFAGLAIGVLLRHLLSSVVIHLNFGF